MGVQAGEMLVVWLRLNMRVIGRTKADETDFPDDGKAGYKSC
jgi:hypothetical protein